MSLRRDGSIGYELRSSDGDQRVSMETGGSDASTIVLQAGRNEQTVTLSANEAGSGISLGDASGVERLRLALKDPGEGPGVLFKEANGMVTLKLPK